MNLHPIIIHFPIASLILYSGIEILSLFSGQIKKNFTTTKYFLLFVGVIGTFAALQSGEVAQELLGRSELIHTHEEFGEKTHMLYSILTIVYAIDLIITHRIGSKYRASLTQQHIPKISAFIHHTYTKYCIAACSIIGLVLLSITGALGGAISHGKDTDPIVKIVYDLLISE